MKTRKRKIEIGIVSDVANFRRKIIIGLAALLMGIFVLSASAQCEAKNDAFKSGEHVMYDLYFNWKFVWVKAGLASLTTNATTYHSEPAYRINLLALGSKRADFFFKMRDTLTCVIGEKLEPHYFRKGAEEGKRYTVDEAWFSYKDGLCFANQKRTYRDGSVTEPGGRAGPPGGRPGGQNALLPAGIRASLFINRVRNHTLAWIYGKLP